MNQYPHTMFHIVTEALAWPVHFLHLFPSPEFFDAIQQLFLCGVGNLDVLPQYNIYFSSVYKQKLFYYFFRLFISEDVEVVCPNSYSV